MGRRDARESEKRSRPTPRLRPRGTAARPRRARIREEHALHDSARPRRARIREEHALHDSARPSRRARIREEHALHDSARPTCTGARGPREKRETARLRSDSSDSRATRESEASNSTPDPAQMRRDAHDPRRRRRRVARHGKLNYLPGEARRGEARSLARLNPAHVSTRCVRSGRIRDTAPSIHGPCTRTSPAGMQWQCDAIHGMCGTIVGTRGATRGRVLSAHARRRRPRCTCRHRQ